MKEHILSTKQAKFLKKYQREYPFNLIDWTVSRVLKEGGYSEKERIALNKHIEMWKEHRKKFD
jgi:hypothetical protein